MQTLHVIMNQQHIEATRLPGKTVVVLDVVFATTTIAMALHHGATDVLTVSEVEQARRHQGLDDIILAGEKDAVVPDGFVTFAPMELSRQPLAGKRLVLVTTNGTVALDNSRGAAHIYTAALVNANAVVRRLLERHRQGTILLVCSASRHRFNIEDFFGAGVLVQRLTAADPTRFSLTDAAIASRNLARGTSVHEALFDSRVGRMMRDLNLQGDLELAARMDAYDILPELIGESVVVSGT
jgi:2-phosphosulfolactate phosphatase